MNFNAPVLVFIVSVAHNSGSKPIDPPLGLQPIQVEKFGHTPNTDRWPRDGSVGI